MKDKNILEIIKEDPYLGVATFGSMGWQMDNFAHEYIYNRLKEVGFDTDDYEKWEATIICSALMAAICHESAVDDPYEMDQDLSTDTCEILLHGMIHPENLATIINIEQGWKIVTTHERMENIIAGYLFSNKGIKGISRRHINDLEIDKDHTHVVVLQDVSLSKPMIGEFNIDDFNIEVQSGFADDYDDDEDDDYDYDDDFDDDDLDDMDDDDDDGWIDYNYDQIDDIIDGMINTNHIKRDYLNNFWELFTVTRDDSDMGNKNHTPVTANDHSFSKDIGQLPPKSKPRVNKEQGDSNVHDIVADKDNVFYKHINTMKF